VTQTTIHHLRTAAGICADIANRADTVDEPALAAKLRLAVQHIEAALEVEARAALPVIHAEAANEEATKP